MHKIQQFMELEHRFSGEKKRIFEKMTKNDQKMAKVQPPTQLKFITPKFFELSILENVEIPREV